MKSSENRFRFGRNWLSFLNSLNEDVISNARLSLEQLLNLEDSKDKSFLDVGSGSGLHSLAAKRNGIENILSFDYDIQSVECTKILKEKYYANSSNWIIERGSILDIKYLSKIGKYDIVYSWGVLHHTGKMYEAMKNIDLVVKKGGILVLAIYNDQGYKSKIWTLVKFIYNRFKISRPLLVMLGYLYFWAPHILFGIIRLDPNKKWREYKRNRGMSPHYDLIDWLGGYPFEVAKPEDIIEYYLNKNYSLKKLVTCGGKLGCNEFVFIKK